MKKITSGCLLLPLLIAFTLPVPAQTRPRRVSQAPAAPSVAATPAADTGRPRVLRAGANSARRDVAREQPRVREGGRRWPWLLLESGLAVGLGTIGGGRGCAPSRGVLLGQHRPSW